MKALRALKKMIKNKDKIKKTVAPSELKNMLHACMERVNHIAAMQQLQLECLNKLMPEGERLDLADFQKPPLKSAGDEKTSLATSSKEAVAALPFLLAEKTYNTAHPKYDANLVRNFPCRIFNPVKSAKNKVYQALLPHMKETNGVTEIPDNCWDSILRGVLDEVKEVPHSHQVFERIAYIENYIKELSARYKAHYMAGWVNLEDALFLYWMVRKLKPKTIVQTGVCNGLSSALMMLALAKNGPEGRLHVIDLPAVFDPKDPAWTVKGKVYGVLIPEGKTSGWIVPDAYHDRFEVQCGDAKELLPKLIDRLDSIDMFYHDSDHTYNHMMFEFKEAKRKLIPGGLVIGDDISWNESLWDFADLYKVPAYNYKGAVGVAFF